MADPIFTRQQLHQEIINLREAFGTIDFWDKPGTVEIASKAIWFVYLNTPSATTSDLISVEAILGELERRWLLVTLNPRGDRTPQAELNIPPLKA